VRNRNKPKPGTLFWYQSIDSRHIEMLIGIKEEPSRGGEKGKGGKGKGEIEYKYTFLDGDGEIFIITSLAKNIEKDPLWKRHYKRIELL
jgi:hypothetical protein